MASERQRRTGGKATHANFVGIERSVLNSDAFIALSLMARALYLDLRRQFNGRNNGDICAADEVLRPYGWSHSSIAKALKLLMEHGLIVKTRQGGIGAMSRTPCLYGFTDLPIMANPAKGVAGAMPSLAYREFKPAPKPKRVRKKVEGSRGEREGAYDGPLNVHGVTVPLAKVQVVDLQSSPKIH